MGEITSELDIRYVKLEFTLTFPNSCVLPISKASAIRGGMGEMLLRANCIRDRNCDNCDFVEECIVQRTMYLYWSSFLVTLCSEIMLHIEPPLVSYNY